MGLGLNDTIVLGEHGGHLRDTEWRMLITTPPMPAGINAKYRAAVSTVFAAISSSRACSRMCPCALSSAPADVLCLRQCLACAHLLPSSPLHRLVVYRAVTDVLCIAACGHTGLCDSCRHGMHRARASVASGARHGATAKWSAIGSARNQALSRLADVQSCSLPAPTLSTLV